MDCELSRCSRLLVIKPSSLGDVVHTLPAVHLLKQARPDLRISWVVNPEWAPLLEGNPDLDSVLLFPRQQFRGAAGLIRLFRWLRETRWPKAEIALDFQGLTRSALLARLAGADRVHCLGDAEWMPRLLADRVVPSKRDCHAVDRYLRLIADLGVPTERPLVFPLPKGQPPAGFDPAEPFLLIHPFSRGEGKSLTHAALKELCERLAPRRVVVVGRTEGAPELPVGCVDLCNRTSLAELIGLIRVARFTVSVDSGPMHIAAALTDRLLGIHTWSDPRLVGPYDPRCWVWKGRIAKVAELSAGEATSNTPFGERAVPELADFLQAL